jgi:hypothetical protein
MIPALASQLHFGNHKKLPGKSYVADLNKKRGGQLV